MRDYTYDVALSFAGEDRDYAKQVADILRANGVRVFYDEYERANLWGKELITYKEEIFGNRAKYVIIFVSKSYLVKDWTNHEFKIALNRAFREKNEYILPVRLDDTKLPGLHDSIGYLTGILTPSEICDAFLGKLGMVNAALVQPTFLLYRLTIKPYAKDMTGMSGIFGGRWNKEGTRALYASTSISLAYLEMLTMISTHLGDLAVVQYSIPARTRITTVYESELESNWHLISDKTNTQAIGDRWLNENSTCILSVPSRVVRNERNYLLNPNNNEFAKLSVNKIEDFEFAINM